MYITPSKRLVDLTPDMYELIERYVIESRKEKKDIVDLSAGSPDLPPPAPIVKELFKQVRKPGSQRYTAAGGIPELRRAVASWYRTKLGVVLNPETEVFIVMGTRETAAQIALTVLNPSDIALTPDPGYDCYKPGIILAGGRPLTYPLYGKNNYHPVVSEIPKEIVKQTKLMIVNYPHNPTGAVASSDLFKEIVDWANRNNIVICHDNPYVEIVYDGEEPKSFLQTEGAKQVGVELFSFSKTYNMAGWRLGAIVGNEKVIEAYRLIKRNIDCGPFLAMQFSAMEALKIPQSEIEKLVREYEERMNTLVAGLGSIGWTVKKPRGTLYVWAPVPAGQSSTTFAERMLREVGIAVRPGRAYGKNGEGYVRFSITQPVEIIREGIRRLKNMKL